MLSAPPPSQWAWLSQGRSSRLYARGRLSRPCARTFALVAGAVDDLSIGFRTVKGHVDPKSRIRKIDQVELWEISIVTFPLLAGARVRAVKEARFSSQPKPSFARARAEREWMSVWQGDPPPGLPDMQSLAPIRVPSAKRLETVHARRQAPPRRDRIRGWISEQAVRTAGDRKAMFATPAR
jgi:hypothetical protein